MAALEGSTYPNIYGKRDSVGVTLPMMESHLPSSKRELQFQSDVLFKGIKNNEKGDGRSSAGSTGSLKGRDSGYGERPPSSGRQSEQSTPDRPISALLRGVSITEHSDPKVNPEPIISEEAEILLEEYLSPRKLRALTGVEDLDSVHYLEMKVDTRDTSLGNFGSHLPNLSQLKLSNSIISTVRDLGSCLDALKVLWMARCGVEDLDGLPSMTSLRELYLAYNEISDISPCSMLENLQILDLEGNNIDNVSQIHFLSLCSNLENLTLEGNPVCTTPSPDTADPTYNYRSVVKSIIPQVKTLDDETLRSDESSHELRESKSNTSVTMFEDDWKLIDELIDQGLMVGAEDNVELDVPLRPGTGVRPSTGYRPGSALKPYTALRPSSRAANTPSSSLRPRTSGVRPSTSDRPGSSASSDSRPGTASTRQDSAENDMSDLTTGVVVCGNPSKALRARRGAKKPSTLTSALKKRAQRPPQQSMQQPSSNYGEMLENDDQDLKELLSEIKQWKSIHAERQAELNSKKVPDVLRIDHDEAENASGNEVSTDEEELAEYLRPGSRSSSRADDRLAAFTGGVRPKTRSKKERPKEKEPETKTVQKRFKSPASVRRMRQTFEESHEASDPAVSPLNTPPTPPSSDRIRRVNGYGSYKDNPQLSSPLHNETAHWSQSSESVLSRKFRKNVYADKVSNSKSMDQANPVIKSSIRTTPESISREGGKMTVPGRPPLSKLQSPPAQQLNKIRKGQLANVQLLPSPFPPRGPDMRK